MPIKTWSVHECATSLLFPFCTRQKKNRGGRATAAPGAEQQVIAMKISTSKTFQSPAF